MYKKIKIGEKEMEFAANAATPIRFKMVFKKDLFYIFADQKRSEEQGIETVSQLAYIMNRQAEKADMSKLNEKTFVEWLEGFEPMAFLENSEEILNLFLGQMKGTARP